MQRMDYMHNRIKHNMELKILSDSEIKIHTEAPVERSKVCIGSSKNLESKLRNDDINTEERIKLTMIETNLENNRSSDFNIEKNINKSEVETSFYGINIPAGFVIEEEINLVYTDQKEALSVVKKYNGARFKMFKTKTEALEFANSQNEMADPFNDINSTNQTGEKPSAFPAPKHQDFVRFRKSIESGDMEKITETIWSNPRYLVSNGDTPTILQEGSRYNALHVAAKFKQYEIAKLILNIVESEKFMQLLYNDETETCLQRVSFITDLYVNTPDKGLNETPLHFACKYGSPEIVSLLLNHSFCDWSLKNKYGQTANELICARCLKETPELISAIEECFNNRFYIPVLRTTDNTKLPSIGEPYSPNSNKPLLLIKISDNPVDLPLSVEAYAGPMSPTQAAEFHKRITTPVRSNFNRSISKLETSYDVGLYDVRLSDADKGLERIGRALSSEMNVAWSEHWPFLKCYCNLSTPEGLAKLESFLKSCYNEIIAKENVKNISVESDGIQSICEALRNLHLDSKINYSSDQNSNKRITFECIYPKRHLNRHFGERNHFRDNNISLNMDEFLQRTCEVIGDQIFAESVRFTQELEEVNLTFLLSPHKTFGKAILPYVKCLYDIVVRSADDPIARDNFSKVHLNVAQCVNKMVALNDDSNVRKLFRDLKSPDTDLIILSDLSDDEIGFHNDRVQRAKRKQNKKFPVSTIGNHLKCVMQMLSVTTPAETNESVECKCDWTVYKSEDEFDNIFDNVACTEDTNASKSINGPNFSEDSLSSRKVSKSSSSDVSADLYFTPKGSLKSSSRDSVSEAHTPDEGLAVYLGGSTPSKIDIDVMRAIENMFIDPNLYPNIQRYKFFMNMRMQEQDESFADSFNALRSNSPLTSTPLRTFRRKVLFDKSPNFSPFKDKNNINYSQNDLFLD